MCVIYIVGVNTEEKKHISSLFPTLHYHVLHSNFRKPLNQYQSNCALFSSSPWAIIFFHVLSEQFLHTVLYFCLLVLTPDSLPWHWACRQYFSWKKRYYYPPAQSSLSVTAHCVGTLVVIPTRAVWRVCVEDLEHLQKLQTATALIQ